MDRLQPRTHLRYHIDFSQDERYGYVHYAKGLTEVGPVGRWTQQKEAGMEFVKPLLKQPALTLHAWGYRPNAGRMWWCKWGEERQSFKLGARKASARCSSGTVPASAT